MFTNKASYEEKRLKFIKNKKKILTLHNEIYCAMNFLGLLVHTSKKYNFFSISESMFAVFPQTPVAEHTSCSFVMYKTAAPQ